MILRRFLKRHLPEPHKIHGHKHLRFLGDRLHDPNLWHLTRNSAAGGASVGLFLAFVPVPGQMLLAALAAIALRVNLPIAVLGVWLTNPLTTGPIFVFAYELGAWLMNEPATVLHFELSIDWLAATVGNIWRPLLLGHLALGVFSAVVSNVAIRLLWRLHLIRRWRNRRRRQTRVPVRLP